MSRGPVREAFVLRGQHEEPVEEVDHQGGRAEGREPAPRPGDEGEAGGGADQAHAEQDRPDRCGLEVTGREQVVPRAVVVPLRRDPPVGEPGERQDQAQAGHGVGRDRTRPEPAPLAVGEQQPQDEEGQQPEDAGQVQDVARPDPGREADPDRDAEGHGLGDPQERRRHQAPEEQRREIPHRPVRIGEEVVERDPADPVAEPRQRGLEEEIRDGHRPHQRPQAGRRPGERAREVPGDRDERRDVPGVQGVVGPVVDGVVRQQRPRVPDDDQRDQGHLDVVEPGIACAHRCGSGRRCEGLGDGSAA